MLDGQSEVLTYRSLKQAFQRKGDFDLEVFNRMMEEIGLYHHENLHLVLPDCLPSVTSKSKSVKVVSEREELEYKENSINFKRFCEVMGVKQESFKKAASTNL